MEYNYNDTMTISTSGPKNEMNARWALQNTLEGKALVYNECIKPPYLIATGRAAIEVG